MSFFHSGLTFQKPLFSELLCDHLLSVSSYILFSLIITTKLLTQVLSEH